MKKLSFQQRADLCTNSTAKKLFTLIAQKKTNLALSADVTSAKELIHLAETLGPEICLLKTHIDIISDFHPGLITILQTLATKHQFLLFEDRKFADIGNTVLHQYQDGIYHIADWAHLINAHLLPGEGIITGLKKIGMQQERGLLLIAQMSSAGNLFDQRYTAASVAMALKHAEFVIGFICQKKLTEDPRFLHLTPGVNLATNQDQLGQNYLTPEHVIVNQGTDIIIVGRGIYEATDSLATAKLYRQLAWNAYTKLI